MFFRALLFLFLPSCLVLGGWIGYYHYFPAEPFSFSPPLPIPASTYQRQGVVKELYLQKGECWQVGCEEAVLTAPRKGFGEWTEAWYGVTGGWDSKGIKRTFSADEALYFFSMKSLEAKHISLEEEGKIHLVAENGEIHLQPGTPLCRLEGDVKGTGGLDEQSFSFKTPALLYQGGKIVSFGGHSIDTASGHFEGHGPLEIVKGDDLTFLQKEGGIFVNTLGWNFPFEGDLQYDGKIVEIRKGIIKGESDCFSFSGHSMKAFLNEGEISDMTLGDGVTLIHRITKTSDPIQTGEADRLDLHLGMKEGLLSGKSEDEPAFFADKTHGVDMEVDALFFRWNDEGKIEGVEGRGEMTLTTKKGGR